jgi:hypothetical protein
MPPDMAVNESNSVRVTDSAAIRSGLVPKLKHGPIARRIVIQDATGNSSMKARKNPLLVIAKLACLSTGPRH